MPWTPALSHAARGRLGIRLSPKPASWRDDHVAGSCPEPTLLQASARTVGPLLDYAGGTRADSPAHQVQQRCRCQEVEEEGEVRTGVADGRAGGAVPLATPGQRSPATDRTTLQGSFAHGNRLRRVGDIGD